MEKNCVYCFYCNRPIYSDEVHYQFGNTYVCVQCGAIHTIRDVCNVIETDIRVSPVTIEVSETAGTPETVETVETVETENSLSGKTESGHEGDEAANSITCAEDMYEYEAKRLSKEDYFNKYVPDIMDKDGPSAMARDIWEKLHSDSSLSGKTESSSADTANIPDYWHDAENMSEEDYVSKYDDNPVALDYWLSVHG